MAADEQRYTYTWVLTPDVTPEIVQNMNSYGCYDDRCLISTFFRDEILDFAEDVGIRPSLCKFNSKCQYVLVFTLNKVQFDIAMGKLIEFSTGTFKTSSIYVKRGEEWVKLWKKGKFYDVATLKVAEPCALGSKDKTPT